LFLLTKLTKILEPLTPKTFDKNELFVLAIVVVCVGVFILIRSLEPQLLQTEIIALVVFNLVFATTGDRMLAEPPLDFYDTLDMVMGNYSMPYCK
jgi:hypothetical protein